MQSVPITINIVSLNPTQAIQHYLIKFVSDLVYIRANPYSTYNFIFCYSKGIRARVFNATFNNISVVTWQAVLLVEKIRVPGENH
jgi:hypothetical protein